MSEKQQKIRAGTVRKIMEAKTEEIILEYLKAIKSMRFNQRFELAWSILRAKK